MDKGDVTDDGALSFAAAEARAAIERITATLAHERAELETAAKLLRAAGKVAEAEEAEALALECVPHVDDSSPPSEDWFFRLLTIAYPGGITLKDASKYFLASTQHANRRANAKRDNVKRRMPGLKKYRGEPMSRERVRQIEASGLRKLKRVDPVVLRALLEELLERDKARVDPLIYATTEGKFPTCEDAARARDPMSERLRPNKAAARKHWATRLAPKRDHNRRSDVHEIACQSTESTIDKAAC